MLNLNLYMSSLPLLLLAAPAFSQLPTSPRDTLVSQVAHWRGPKPDKKKDGPVQLSSELLKGPTRDLSLLDIHAFTLDPGGSSPAISQPETDALVIVKEGSLTIDIHDSAKVLGPGGVGLFAGGSYPRFTNTGTTAATWFVFLFRSWSPKSPDKPLQAGPPLLIDWKDMVMKKTEKGESRQIFDRPLAWLSRIDMHATTLDPGQVSHPPHVHRTEELIIMRSGTVQEYIAGGYHKASAGDLIFLASGVPHAVENKGRERCEYFALQWRP